MTDRTVSRRTLLAGAGAGVFGLYAAGCGGSSAQIPTLAGGPVGATVHLPPGTADPALVPGPKATDANRSRYRVLNTILGGSFTSRLNQNLREQHGYSYGSQSMFNRLKDSGWFVAQAAVRSDATAESLTEMLKEVARLERMDAAR